MYPCQRETGKCEFCGPAKPEEWEAYKQKKLVQKEKAGWVEEQKIGAHYAQMLADDRVKKQEKAQSKLLTVPICFNQEHYGKCAMHGALDPTKWEEWKEKKKLKEKQELDADEQETYIPSHVKAAKEKKALAALQKQDKFSQTEEAREKRRARRKAKRESAQTQKANGVLALVNAGFKTPTLYAVLRGFERFKVQFALGEMRDKGSKIMARPCPLVPQPGFVDSRVVTSAREIYQVVSETRDADARGEVMLMEAIEARLSATLTRGLLTIGEGNDGATQGRGAMVLPIRGDIRALREDQLEEAGITKEAHYEVVYGADERTYWTQARDGERIESGSVDYVPSEMRVSKVIEPQGDMLTWPKVLEKERATYGDGLVVWHAGGSLADHWGLNCMMRGVAYVTSHEPRVGDALAPTKEIKSANVAYVLDGMRLEEAYVQRSEMNSDDMRRLVETALFVLHNATWLGATHEGARLIGIALQATARAAIMAIRGEMRHKVRTEGANRDEVYMRYMRDPQMGKRVLGMSHRSFERGRWRAGYGGPAWADCARSTAMLVNAIIDFQRKPSDEALKEAIGALNTVINVAHNNGKFLSKFTSVFNAAASGEATFIVRMAPTLWKVGRFEGRSATLPWKNERKVLAKVMREIAEQKESGRVIVRAVACVRADVMHVQIKLKHESAYVTYDKLGSSLPEGWQEALSKMPVTESMAGSGKTYYTLDVDSEGHEVTLYDDGIVILICTVDEICAKVGA